MPKHAYLSASSSHRWIECPPSAKLCAQIVDSGSSYAQQGTDAHTLCEYKVQKALGKYIPVSMVEPASTSTPLTAMVTKVSPVALTISRRFVMVNLLVVNPEPKTILQLMMTIFSLKKGLGDKL